MNKPANGDAQLDRQAVESCFLDVLRGVGQHTLSGAEESVLAAVFMAGSIHSALERAARDNDVDAARARLTILLDRLQQLVSEWSPNDREDIADALFALAAEAKTVGAGTQADAVA